MSAPKQDCDHCPRVAELEQQLVISRRVNDGLRREREHLLLGMPTTGCAEGCSHSEHRGDAR